MAWRRRKVVRGSRRRAAWVTVTAALLSTLLLLTGCTRERDALTIYSGRGEGLVRPLLERFAEETNIPVDVEYDDSANLALRIDQEGDRTRADVFLSQSPGTVGYLAGKDRLGTIDAELLDRVPEQFSSPKGLWVGVSGRQRVLVYNTELVAEEDLPQSVFDLTDPRYAGKVGLAPANASFEDFISSMREL